MGRPTIMVCGFNNIKKVKTLFIATVMVYLTIFAKISFIFTFLKCGSFK